MTENTFGYFNDDGTEINPDLIPKPSLCVSCKKNNESGQKEIFCILTRADQQGEREFRCEDYQPRQINQGTEH
jgi:hypothetical protein